MSQPSYSQTLQRGYILVLALVFLGIFATAATAYISALTTSARSIQHDIASTQALSLAEAGTDEAIYQLRQTVGYSGETNTALGAGTFTVTLASLDPITEQITVTASVPNATSPVAQRTIVTQAVNAGSYVHFDYSVEVGAGGLRMDNNSRVNGDMYSNGNVVGSSGATITGTSTVTSGASTPPDQEWLDQTGDFSFANVAAQQSVAQSFIPTVTDHLTTAYVYIRKVGNPGGSVHARIVTDDGTGSPSNTQVDSADIKTKDIGTDYDFIAVNFNSPTLTAGQKYWLEMDAGVNASKYFQWGIDTTDDFPNNTGKYTTTWNGNTAWSNAGGDFMFVNIMGSNLASFSGVTAGGNVYADSMKNCSIGGDAYYQSISNCTISGTSYPGSAPPPVAPFPITDAQVTGWESWAQTGGVIAGPYTISGSTSLGPKEINGDLTINGTLTLTGTVWVNGKITFGAGATVKVDPSLGNNGAILIADNTSDHTTSSTVFVNNNVTMTGNGQPNNYIMVVAMNADPKREAIELKNNASATTVFFAPYGYIDVHNNVSANNLLAYKLHLHNNTTVTYQAGSPDKTFAGGSGGGPGGTWVFNPGTYVISK